MSGRSPDTSRSYNSKQVNQKCAAPISARKEGETDAEQQRNPVGKDAAGGVAP